MSHSPFALPMFPRSTGIHRGDDVHIQPEPWTRPPDRLGRILSVAQIMIMFYWMFSPNGRCAKGCILYMEH